MPLYEYRCTSCDTQFECIVPHTLMSAKCPQCGGFVSERLPSAPAVHFKGSGFYATDYQAPKGAKVDE